MQRSLHIDLLATLSSAFDDFEIPCDGPPSLIVHVPCSFIADPGVGTSPARVDPHDVLKPEIGPQGYVDDFDGHGDERPAFVADVRLIATCSDLVVICQVDIENKLFRKRSESGRFAEGFAISWVGGVDWTDLETGWI